MYPLKFLPVFQERVWGGRRLRALLGKPTEGGLVGEAWELADLPAGTVRGDSAGAGADGALSSVIANGAWAGRTLHEILNSEFRIQNSEFHGYPIMGRAALNHGYFPLLVKFLDAQRDLSVQVHPDAAYCAAHPGAHVKSEAWYVLHAEPGARIYKGVKKGVTREAFRGAIERGEGGGVEPLLNAIRVRAGDCFYLKSGTVHALGAGIVAAEVQTPSDTTFRVFDWNRLGADGKGRTLHIEEALECIDFAGGAELDGSGAQSEVGSVGGTTARLVTCEYFTLDRVRVGRETELEIPGGEPAVWIVAEGQGVINVDGPPRPPTAFARGDTLLLPAGMKGKARTVTECAWLEARLPLKRIAIA